MDQPLPCRFDLYNCNKQSPQATEGVFVCPRFLLAAYTASSGRKSSAHHRGKVPAVPISQSCCAALGEPAEASANRVFRERHAWCGAFTGDANCDLLSATDGTRFNKTSPFERTQQVGRSITVLSRGRWFRSVGAGIGVRPEHLIALTVGVIFNMQIGSFQMGPFALSSLGARPD